jgi:hypothetical protein
VIPRHGPFIGNFGFIARCTPAYVGDRGEEEVCRLLPRRTDRRSRCAEAGAVSRRGDTRSVFPETTRRTNSRKVFIRIPLNEERFLFDHFSAPTNPLADFANRRVVKEARKEGLLLQKELTVFALFQ